MSVPLDDLLTPGRTLRPGRGGVLSALPAEAGDAPYDRWAALYDCVVGSTIYNRLVWGTSPSAFGAFAAAAVAEGRGPLLDVACGSAVFTAATYRRAGRPVVLVDRSTGMLLRASWRLAGQDHIVLLQADLFDLPFAPGGFATVACHGTLHLFADLLGVLRTLRSQLAPGGVLYATSLVAETPLGGRLLHLAHRRGEMVARRETELAAGAAAELRDVTLRREGCMAFLTGRA